MRIITLNVNGIRSAGAQGPRPLARARRAVGRRLPAGDQGASRRHAAAMRAPRRSHARFPPRARRRATAASALYAPAPDAVRTRLRQRRVRRRGPLPRGGLRRAHGDQRVPAVGLERPASPGIEVPLSRRVPAAPRSELRDDGREVILCGDWNIAHQPIDLRNWRSNQKNSGFLPEERAWLDARVRRAGLRRRVPPRRSASRSSTRGGRIAARPGRRTSAGASTTRSRRRASPRRRMRAAIYKNERFSDHAPLIIDYDV